MSSPIDRVLDALASVRSGAKKTPTGWSARCPAHDDKSPSLSITVGGDGRVLLNCFVGCDFARIVAGLGLAEQDMFPPKDAPPKKAKRKAGAPLGPVVASYIYADAAGGPLYQVRRHDPKEFTQRRSDGNGGWISGRNGIARVLYQLPKVIDAAKAGAVVFVAEGEKGTESLARLGMVATNACGGASADWTDAHTEALRGASFAAHQK